MNGTLKEHDPVSPTIADWNASQQEPMPPIKTNAGEGPFKYRRVSFSEGSSRIPNFFNDVTNEGDRRDPSFQIPISFHMRVAPPTSDWI